MGKKKHDSYTYYQQKTHLRKDSCRLKMKIEKKFLVDGNEKEKKGAVKVLITTKRLSNKGHTREKGHT